MLLKVLVENNTLIDQYYLGEPGVSFYIEDGDSKILFDTGYSDIIIKNAEKMGIHLQDINTIVFSHGHNDHTAGLQYLVQRYDLTNVDIVAHPDCFLPKMDEKEYFGSPYHEDKLRKICQLKLMRKPYRISKHITFLGEIPSSNYFEKRSGIGVCNKKNHLVTDYVMDDSAIMYKDKEGIFIITGCSHSGICNMIEYAKEVSGESRIKGVIGGFHLFHENEILEKTIQYMKENDINDLYPCHCVSFHVKAIMNGVLNVHEVGVGLEVKI